MCIKGYETTILFVLICIHQILRGSPHKSEYYAKWVLSTANHFKSTMYYWWNGRHILKSASYHIIYTIKEKQEMSWHGKYHNWLGQSLLSVRRTWHLVNTPHLASTAPTHTYKHVCTFYRPPSGPCKLELETNLLEV